MDYHFKMARAAEEIERLNVEIRRVATYLRDEDHYLRSCEERVHQVNPQLAYQLSLYRLRRGRFNLNHVHCLADISRLKGFSGTISPGQSIDTGIGSSANSRNNQVPLMDADELYRQGEGSGEGHGEADMQGDLEEEEDAEADSEELARAFYDVLNITDDS